MLPGFGDLRWFTAFSECGVDISRFYEGLEPGCDVYGRPDTANTPFSVWIPRFLGIGYAHTEAIGVGMGVGFVVLFLFQVFRLVCCSWLRLYVVATCLLGLPFLLAAERGSTDLVIYGLLALLAFLLGSQRPFLRSALAPCTALLAILLKIYPVFGVLGWAGASFLFDQCSNSKRLAAVLQICAALLGIGLLAPWLHYPRSAPLPDGSFFSHGMAPSFSDYFKPYFSQGPLVSSVKLVFLALSCWLARRLGLPRLAGNLVGRCSEGRELMVRRALIFHVLAFLSWLGCYFFTSSYDYRLLFLYPGVVLFAACHEAVLRAGRFDGLAVYLIAVLLLWPFSVVMPLLYASGFAFSAWTEQLVWLIERLSDTLFIPIVAGAMLAVAVDPVALRKS